MVITSLQRGPVVFPLRGSILEVIRRCRGAVILGAAASRDGVELGMVLRRRRRGTSARDNILSVRTITTEAFQKHFNFSE